MSIRIRLVIMCLVVALLPAVPLTLLVQSLLDKSFDVGLSSTVEDGLQSGLRVSREGFEAMRADFEGDVFVLASLDAAVLEAHLGPRDGVIAGSDAPADDGALPAPLRPFETNERFKSLVGSAAVTGRSTESGRDGVHFFDLDNRTAQMAVWTAGGGTPVLYFRQTDPEFLADAQRLIEGRQIFAQLRLTRGGLARSFFYPFIIIYAVCVVVALALALLMAERMAEPLRRLVRGAGAVAAGDWSTQVDAGRASGETERLVHAFNAMVSQLDDQRRRLVDVEKMAAWRDVARHLAHEIKNPLLPIRLTVEEIRDQYHGDDEKFREFLRESTRVIGDEVEHLQQLVKSFSAFAKMPEPNPARGSLDAIVADVVRLYPQIDTTVSGSVPEFDFDADQMRRVVTNLFDNVISVAGDGAEVAIGLGAEGGSATLRFADNGPGIPADNLARIFEPYFTTRADGSGLGLAMLKNIVLAHGGTVDVESRVGSGTIFIINLPLTAAHEPTKG